MDFFQDNDPTTAFWQWFYQNHNLIKEVLDAEETHPSKFAIVNALDNHVLGFGKFKWQVEFGQQKDFSFTISPNGDEKLLAISTEIMAAAPELPDWEFHPAKAPKDWDFKFSIYDELMFVHEIDASDWRFVILSQKEGKVAVILEAPNIIDLELGVQTNAGNIVLTNMIGEATKILKVADFLIIKAFSSTHQKQCAPIQEIGLAFDKLAH